MRSIKTTDAHKNYLWTASAEIPYPKNLMPAFQKAFLFLRIDKK